MAGETARSFEVLSGLAGDPTPEQQAALHAAALFTDSAAARAFRDDMARLEPPGEPLLAGTVAYELAMRNVPAPELVARFGGAALDLSTTGAYGFGIWALLLLERFSEAKAELDRAVEVGRRTGALVSYALALVLRAGLHLRSGALQAAEADAQQSLELSKHPSSRFGNAASMQFLVEILLEQGRLEEAAEAAAAIDPVPQLTVDVLAQQARARVLLAQRRPKEALAAAVALGERVADTVSDNAVLLPWRRTAALAAGALGSAEAVSFARGAARLRAGVRVAGGDRRRADHARVRAALGGGARGGRGGRASDRPRPRAAGPGAGRAGRRRSRRGARAAAAGDGARLGRGGAGAGRRGAGRARRRRRAAAQARRARGASADGGRGARRPAGGRRREQSRDRAGAVRDAQDRRDAPLERLPQARHLLAGSAGREARLKVPARAEEQLAGRVLGQPELGGDVLAVGLLEVVAEDDRALALGQALDGDADALAQFGPLEVGVSDPRWWRGLWARRWCGGA